MDRSVHTSRRVVNSLSHYGVKGMKWGVHNSQSSSGGGAAPRPRLSEDARNVEKAYTKIQTRGTGSLSNKELQSVISRMNLENQYHNLTTTAHKNEIDQGLAQAKRILKVGKTIEETRKFLETPTGKAVKLGVSTAFTAAAAYATGGGSAAAKVGVGLAVRRAANHYTNTGR